MDLIKQLQKKQCVSVLGYMTCVLFSVYYVISFGIER